MAMEDRHLIVTYCRFSGDAISNASTDDYTKVFPQHVLDRIRKAKEAFVRLSESHADDEYMKVLLFGQQAVVDLKNYALSLELPETRIELDTDCRDIAEMVRKIWKRIGTSVNPPRVYFVLSNWQWIFIESILGLKDEQFRFYFEGAPDYRTADEIEADKKMEKVAKIDLKESKLGSILDKVGGSISSNLKG
jgi:hypothetical protein